MAVRGVVRSQYGPVGVTVDPGGGVRAVELAPGWESASASALGHAVTRAVTGADMRRATPVRMPPRCPSGPVVALLALLDRAAAPPPTSPRPGPTRTGSTRRTPHTPGCAGSTAPGPTTRPGGPVRVLAAHGRVLAVVIDAAWLRGADRPRVERELRRALRAARPAPGPGPTALAATPVVHGDGGVVLL